MQSTNKRKVRPGIYKITSSTTGKSYIGQTLYLEDRWRSHLHEVMKGEHPNRKFYKAVMELGISDFTHEILFELEDFKRLTEQEIVNVLNAKEIELIAKYDSKNNGYNTESGGGRTVRADYSLMTITEKEEAKKLKYKINRDIKHKNRTPEQIEKISEQHKKFMKVRRKEKRLTGEWQEYRSKVRQTERYKEYMREYKKKYRQSAEWKAKHKARVEKRKALKLLENNKNKEGENND